SSKLVISRSVAPPLPALFLNYLLPYSLVQSLYTNIIPPTPMNISNTLFLKSRIIESPQSQFFILKVIFDLASNAFSMNKLRCTRVMHTRELNQKLYMEWSLTMGKSSHDVA
ncbi:hypothetical protein M8C21_007171, partial [Ambrosia artemisiifolia]